MIPGTDSLSPLARQVLLADPNAYQAMVVTGSGNDTARQLLIGRTAEDLFGAGKYPDADRGGGALAGLWLWHDWLHESHVISQAIDSPTGSFWHAIMHRREGDFSNSQYWYRRATGHPVMAVLAAQAGAIVHGAPAEKGLLKIIIAGWNPMAFVDFVESAHRHGDEARRRIARELQIMEWRALFDFCTRA
jgi:hypothetical protein